ncbi:hypothetical protein SAMN05421854_13214 [Amycolatopsis rubida]|uniref:Uncharacterized protein n=1 Tax=Amycolatopsis rubida TaxID=112413 RepID=A0A1I6BMF7_9PSEU|nr:hypothetical protein SAMN05421854_13214 [Amycolatopsis rubida]
MRRRRARSRTAGAGSLRSSGMGQGPGPAARTTSSAARAPSPWASCPEERRPRTNRTGSAPSSPPAGGTGRTWCWRKGCRCAPRGPRSSDDGPRPCPRPPTARAPCRRNPDRHEALPAPRRDCAIYPSGLRRRPSRVWARPPAKHGGSRLNPAARRRRTDFRHPARAPCLSRTSITGDGSDSGRTFSRAMLPVTGRAQVGAVLRGPTRSGAGRRGPTRSTWLVRALLARVRGAARRG